MVFEVIITGGLRVAAWIIGMVPPIPAQALQEAVAPFLSIASVMVSMSVWVNWLLVGAQALAVFGLYFTTLLLKVVRALLGHIPWIGGNG